MSNRGVFITFEGGEGGGKSTQVKMLQDYLAKCGIDVVMTREPGGTPQAEKIRELLIWSDGNFEPLTEALLLFAGRHEHVVHKIRPALDNGQWVVSDRFADSTRAMQGKGHGLDQNLIEQMYTMAVGDIKPDLTFIFDLDPTVGLARAKKRNALDRFERMPFDFHQRLRQGFLDVAKAEPERCVVIDAAQDVDTIHGRIVDVIERRFQSACKKGTSHG